MDNGSKNNKTESVRIRDKRGSDLWQLTRDQFHLIRFPLIDEDGNKLNKLNKRIDFGNIPEFAETIMAYGKIEKAIFFYKKDGFYNVTDGERRCKAAMFIADNYGIEIEIPAISEPRGTTVADRLFKQIILNNSGKAFSPVEDSEVIAELISQGVSEKDICEKLKYSKVYMSNLKLLQKSPEKIKILIGKNVLTSTLAMDILRENKNFDDAIKVIEDTMAFNQATKGTTKITKKDLVKSKGAVNSYSAVRKAMTKANTRTIRIDKIELFNTLKAIHDGEYTLEFLLAELYEPEVEGATAAKKSAKKESKQSAMELKAD